MTDLLDVLPEFDLKPFTHLLHSLEKAGLTVADLLTTDPTEIAKECPLPLSDVRKLVGAVSGAVQQDIQASVLSAVSEQNQSTSRRPIVVLTEEQRSKEAQVVKFHDALLDDAIGGGFRTGHIIEIAGESSVGKTQIALMLLLAAQLDPPHGLGRPSLYISTEASLNTTRLQQMLDTNELYQSLNGSGRPSLDRVLSVPVNDMEAQDHIIEFQLPLAVKKHNIGLVVMDSVAANYRAEYETKSKNGLANRAWDLGNLGRILRSLAVDKNVAVVVMNQVSDRFDEPSLKNIDEARLSSPAFSSSPMSQPQQPAEYEDGRFDIHHSTSLSLDHQQRFFTGWSGIAAKTPALGLSWANQISMRIVLKMWQVQSSSSMNIWSDTVKRRALEVVFSTWAPPTDQMIEYEITSQGVCSKPTTTGASEDLDIEIVNATSDAQLWISKNVDQEEEYS